VSRELVPLAAADGAASQAALYRPTQHDAHVGLVFEHPTVSFMHHYALAPLAMRGFAALGVDSRYAGNEAPLLMDRVAADLSAAVAWLRERCDKVVLVGNSGGGALAAYHQANEAMADALILLNAHRGRAQVLTAWLDPAVVDEADPFSRDPDLDLFERRPPFEAEFLARYRAAQEARNRRISDWARARLREYDQPFVVHRTAADPRFLDLRLDPSDREVGTYWGPDVRAANYAPLGLARFATCRSWLSQWSLDDSEAAAEPNLARCRVPVLLIQGTADQGIFPSDAEALAAAAGVAVHWVRGGTHYFLGQPELQDQVYDLITNWLSTVI
jgi:pimeloyl-ACP methyl ester carboxylesterase